MTNNDIFKKLRVALMLRDDQIVEILELVDFRISKSELGAFFRDEKHPNYVECGDQVLRNFLNGLVIHLRGTKENPKNPKDILAKHKAEIPVKTKEASKSPPKAKTDFKKKPSFKKSVPKVQVVEKVKFNNGKNKKS
ncbi:Protein of unknown function [Flavobacterium glycines]|jgi:hypothetical protein|uniref:Uncharacterized protein n=1 Tax=Flavobacterium glycines TaxID=551990 RepID=A0A1B9DYA7_9FLAO|nr:DUF1456 family protein [Flavobacterium glycines]OCB74657.1 hypothetical protein FBGL_01425 [Flavobacterium glycines]GEL09367.1 hypothetical protein FGL01_01060 [Flavobacterium glycines]SDJ09451.1 Protein of unknown function [Flavobacterium glycines]